MEGKRNVLEMAMKNKGTYFTSRPSNMETLVDKEDSHHLRRQQGEGCSQGRAEFQLEQEGENNFQKMDQDYRKSSLGKEQ